MYSGVQVVLYDVNKILPLIGWWAPDFCEPVAQCWRQLEGDISIKISITKLVLDWTLFQKQTFQGTHHYVSLVSIGLFSTFVLMHSLSSLFLCLYHLSLGLDQFCGWLAVQLHVSFLNFILLTSLDIVSKINCQTSFDVRHFQSLI